MRSIGFPELLVLVSLGLMAYVAFLVVMALKRKGGAVGSKFCGHCGQRIPDIGVFCPICGQKSAAVHRPDAPSRSRL
jgi:predicted amidophosphoribosyltransferase